MQPAAQPSNEQQRIRVLNDTGLLDTPAEQLFDSITSALAELFDMPISLVCLVDSERVWLKSSSGLEGVSEIHRSVGFCPHTINQTGIFEVKDASLDERFSDSPVVAEAPYFRYYAGAPLITRDGFALGTLCVMDFKPYELNENQRTHLKNLASTITGLIESRRQINIYQASKEFLLGRAIEMSPNETFLVDITTRTIKYANRAALLNLGMSLNNITSMHWEDILISYPRQMIKDYLSRYNSVFTKPINFTGTQKRGDGSIYPVDCHIHSLADDNTSFTIISRDISQQVEANNREKTLQNNMAYMDRINTANMLSSGLAHELNQPLTAISQYCDTALSIANKENINTTLLQDSLQKATTQALRAGEIIKRYRAFTQKQIPTRSLVNINELTKQTIQLLQHDINKKNISIDIRIDNELPAINVDSIQIQQVILNLLTNSIEALNGNNNCRIEVDCGSAENNRIKYSVSDNGPGIKQTLFNNPVTYSPSSKPNGTGLGLSICNYIIHSHLGKIWHDSEYKDGARIIFTLPIHS